MQMKKTPLTKRREKRQLLIENKLSFAGPDTELSIYDTYRASAGVGFDADQLMYLGMVTGKKVMHESDEQQGKIFLPHESYVMPPGKYVEIDFPDANEAKPTTCLTIEIPKERIELISERMRDVAVLDDPEHDWQYQPQVIHNHHTADTQQLLERLVSLFTHNHQDKEMMVDLGVQELIIKLLRQQGRDILLSYSQESPDSSGITAVLHYLEQNLAIPLDIEQLCREACMSRSRLYIEFKKQLGCSPGEYQQQQRLKRAADYLKNGKTVTEACYDVGFNDLSHFSRRFTLFFGLSPRQFREEHNKENIDKLA
ncbi:AraC family transcriptional regulator [Methylophaga sp. 42_25_T18]|nr:AraC family transcriptional regulator [Methylophaga sp. 42_25_T18]OUR88851.1 AraC family transcriptional regulator [Methylophaga sp. 42_8_T64]